ncbi:hypothetical protein OsJ_01683 [Oryza sativa Japonica Group]|nr:hypothetical protein OsJ_01683 [Oryza sativa Japonica Group]
MAYAMKYSTPERASQGHGPSQARESENAAPCPDFLPCPRCTLPRGSGQRVVHLQRVHQHKSHLRWHGDGDSEWAAHVDQQHKQAKAMPCTSACHFSSTRCPIARGMQSFSKAFVIMFEEMSNHGMAFIIGARLQCRAAAARGGVRNRCSPPAPLTTASWCSSSEFIGGKIREGE